MLYPIRADRFGDLKVMVEVTGFGEPKLLVNNQLIKHTVKKNHFAIKCPDGREAMIVLNFTNFLDPVPAVIVDGQKVKIVRPFVWYQYAAIALPLILAPTGGAIGGGFGCMAAIVNGKIMRSQLPEIVKYLATVGVSAIATLTWLVLGSLLMTSISRR